MVILEEEETEDPQFESSAQIALYDASIVSRIFRWITSSQDRHSVALVCRIWNDVVAFESRSIVVRSRSLLPLLIRKFSRVSILDCTQCCDQLEDQDLEFAASNWRHLHTVFVGHLDVPQEVVTDEGLRRLGENSGKLQHVRLCCLPGVHDGGILSLFKSCTYLRKVELENCEGLTDKSLEALSSSRNLEELLLKGRFKFSPLGLAVIGKHLPRLLKVCFELGSLDVVPVLKSVAKGCPKMQEISLKVRNVDLAGLIECSNLTCLRVETDQRNPMDDVVIQIAKSNNNLQEIVFVNHFEPLNDDAVLGIVQNCRKLEKLHIEALRLTAAAIWCLIECKTLKHLSLDHFKSAGQGLAEIGLCGMELVEFSLRSGRGIRDVELQTLMLGNQKLQYLDLQCCHGPSAIGFSAISGCCNLLSLDLSFTDVDDVSLIAISNGTRQLRCLSLVKCEGIINIGVIARFTHLKSLNIDQCSFVSDIGLNVIAMSCSQLTDLSLAFTRITDRGLYHLTKCSCLRSLRIPYCRDVWGPGIIAIANTCSCFKYAVLGHRFKGTQICDDLKRQCCIVRLEMDDMALVPFTLDLHL